MQLKVDEGFKKQLWPLSPVEFASLEQSIREEGCRERLVVWAQENIIIDGHNRYEICTAEGIPFEVDYREFASRNEVEDWIDKNQAARRNCTPEQYRIITGRIYNRRKKAHGGERQSTDQIDQLKDTSDEVAEEVGVSRGTIVRNGARAEVHDSMLEQGDEEAAAAAATVPQKTIGEARRQPEKSAEILKGAPHVSQNTGEQEWYTPATYIAAAVEVMGRIDLDPASSDAAQKTVRAGRFFSKEDDGLLQDWAGNIWLNPPYASGLVDKFANKLVDSLPDIEQAVVLVNNATETRWFQLLANHADAICFVAKRIKFLDANGEPKQSPLQGQAFFYYGMNSDGFTETFREFGFVCYGITQTSSY